MLGAVYLYGSNEIYVPFALSDLLGPRAFPLGLGVLLSALGMGLLGRAWSVGGAGIDLGRLATLAPLVVSVLLYTYVFQPLGFLVSTTLLLAFLFSLLGERRYWLTGSVALGSTLALYLLFNVVLHVRLPQGILGF